MQADQITTYEQFIDWATKNMAKDELIDTLQNEMIKLGERVDELAETYHHTEGKFDLQFGQVQLISGICTPAYEAIFTLQDGREMSWFLFIDEESKISDIKNKEETRGLSLDKVLKDLMEQQQAEHDEDDDTPPESFIH